MSYPKFPITAVEEKWFVCEVCAKGLLSKRDVTECPVCHTKYVYRHGRMRILRLGSISVPSKPVKRKAIAKLKLEALTVEPLVPQKKIYHVGDWFSRMDEELAILIKLNTRMVELLERGAPPALELAPLIERLDEIIKYERFDYPTFIDDVTFSTLSAAWAPLDINGAGFTVVAIGGGFNLRVPNMSARIIAATVNDKYDMEFGNVYVQGSGVAGTARIRFWRTD